MNNVFKRSMELTLGDFRDHPFWVWCEAEDEAEVWYDDVDSTTFRAYNGPLPVDKTCGLCLTRVLLKNGAVASGLTFYDGENLGAPELFLGSHRVKLKTIDNDGKRTEFHRVITALEGWFCEPIDCLFPIEFRTMEGVLSCQLELTVRYISNVRVCDGSMEVERIPTFLN